MQPLHWIPNPAHAADSSENRRTQENHAAADRTDAPASGDSSADGHTPHPHRQNASTRVCSITSPPKDSISVGVILKVLRTEGVEELVIARFRAHAGVLSRWNRSDRIAMADALTGAEDALEVAYASIKRRHALRDLRRALELELWP
jgi:hypothetical protein